MHPPLRFALLPLCALALFTASCAASASASPEASPRRRVLVLGIDGMRGDVLDRMALVDGRAPAVAGLMQAGIYAPCPEKDDPACAHAHQGWASGPVYQWVTSPGWASVVTGVENFRHEVRGNGFPLQRVFAETSARWPTMFAQARRAGLRAAAGGVGAFLTSREDDGSLYPGIVDYECGVQGQGPAVAPEDTASCNLDARFAGTGGDGRRDEALEAALSQQIALGEADLLMGVFDEVDGAGHAYGFSFNEGYEDAVAVVDAQIGRLVAQVRARAAVEGEAWLVLITSDHGGHPDPDGEGGSHAMVAATDSVVPFIAASFGGPSLTGLRAPATQMDVNPTALTWLGIAPGAVDGQAQGMR